MTRNPHLKSIERIVVYFIFFQIVFQNLATISSNLFIFNVIDEVLTDLLLL